MADWAPSSKRLPYDRRAIVLGPTRSYRKIIRNFFDHRHSGNSGDDRTRSYIRQRHCRSCGYAIAGYCQLCVTHPFKFSAASPFGYGNENHPIRYLFPLAALLTLLVCARDWHTCLRDRLFWQCAAFALAGFLGCFPRPDLSHVTYAVPLACPLLACCITRLVQWWRPAWWRYRYLVVVVAGVMIGLCARTVFDFLEMSQEALRAEIMPTPRGNVAARGNVTGKFGAPELLARIAATPSQDAYFFYPMLSILPFLTAREQVSKYDVFTPGYTLPSQYRDACISVMRRASWVVIDRSLTNPIILKRMFPALRDAKPKETKRFEQAQNKGFELVAQKGQLELRRRGEGASEIVCVGIAE